MSVIPTGADLHHHGALEALQTVADESTWRVLTRTITTHVVRQATLVDVCNHYKYTNKTRVLRRTIHKKALADF